MVPYIYFVQVKTKVMANQEALLALMSNRQLWTIGNAMEIVKIGKKCLELLQFDKFAYHQSFLLYGNLRIILKIIPAN